MPMTAVHRATLDKIKGDPPPVPSVTWVEVERLLKEGFGWSVEVSLSEGYLEFHSPLYGSSEFPCRGGNTPVIERHRVDLRKILRAEGMT